MNDKELYKQKIQAQLDAWKADIDKLKAMSMNAKADAQLEMNSLVSDLEAKSKVANEKLAELSKASEEAWESVKEGVESAWVSLKKSMQEAVAKFKD